MFNGPGLYLRWEVEIISAYACSSTNSQNLHHQRKGRLHNVLATLDTRHSLSTQPKCRFSQAVLRQYTRHQHGCEDVEGVSPDPRPRTVSSPGYPEGIASLSGPSAYILGSSRNDYRARQPTASCRTRLTTCRKRFLKEIFGFYQPATDVTQWHMQGTVRISRQSFGVRGAVSCPVRFLSSYELICTCSLFPP